ncbi:MAG: LON peptidase substrate-binding domain-containing protein [Vicinamibacterales bacterium]
MSSQGLSGRLICQLLLVLGLVAPVPASAQITPLSVPDLPAVIPLFPLPNVAVLPYLQLPLHIFEPRYKEMLADALAGNRVIGIVQIQPGFEADYQGRPPIFGIGCAAIVVANDRQPDGEFDIVVRGFVKFRIMSESGDKAYRVARVEPIPELLDEPARTALHEQRPALEQALTMFLGAAPNSLRLPVMTDEDLVNTLVMSLEFDTVDRQLLIEQPGVLARANKLAEMLGRTPGEPVVPR